MKSPSKERVHLKGEIDSSQIPTPSDSISEALSSAPLEAISEPEKEETTKGVVGQLHTLL